MKVTHQAASHVNSVLQQIEKTSQAFTATPELFKPEFWEYMCSAASNIKSAQMVLTELDNAAQDGITISPYISFNMVQVMRIARTTLRNHEIGKHATDRVLQAIKNAQHEEITATACVV